VQRAGDHGLPGDILSEELETSEAIHAAAHPGRRTDEERDERAAGNDTAETAAGSEAGDTEAGGER
jgi:hypothetical protein